MKDASLLVHLTEVAWPREVELMPNLTADSVVNTRYAVPHGSMPGHCVAVLGFPHDIVILLGTST